MTTATLIFAALALLVLAAAVWLYSLAGTRQRQEGVITRLKTEDEAAPLPTMEGSELQNIPLLGGVSRLMWRAGSNMPPRLLAAWMLGLALLVVVLIAAFGFFGVFMSVAGLLVIYIVLRQRAARRRSRIIEQLPGFLENLIRVMSAGNTLEESIGAAAREASDPIRPLFLSVGRQVKLGAPVDQVLAEAGALYRLRDLKVMSLAASVNRKYGGSLRNVLKSLITAIRQRAMAARELRALTAETRFSAVVLAGIPMGLTTLIYLRNRHYYDVMLNDKKFGFWLLLSTAVLQFVGAFLLWRMVNAVGDADE